MNFLAWMQCSSYTLMLYLHDSICWWVNYWVRLLVGASSVVIVITSLWISGKTHHCHKYVWCICIFASILFLQLLWYVMSMWYFFACMHIICHDLCLCFRLLPLPVQLTSMMNTQHVMHIKPTKEPYNFLAIGYIFERNLERVWLVRLLAKTYNDVLLLD